MRKTATIISLLLIIIVSNLSASSNGAETWEFLKPGPYEVGYLEMPVEIDSTIRLVNETFRRVPVAAWYPDVKKSRNLAKKKVPDKFPVVVFCPGVDGRLNSYLKMARFLTTHGFIVATFPTSGDRYTYGQEVYRWDFRQLQQEYLKLAATKAGYLQLADPNRLAVVGHSYGGPAAINFALSEENVDAVVSLDGTDICSDYTAKMAAQFPAYNPVNLTDPFMLILADASYCTGEKRSLDFYEGISNADAYIVELFKFRHEHFMYMSSYGNDPEIKKSFEIATLYLLNFLKANLFDDTKAAEWLKKSPGDHGLPTDLFEVKLKAKK
ncbi:MAG: hypothetical protein JSV52_06930 [Candidatus Zixiibacteriota bacterium]|nr:MAG: hypothetical protein JSV52_06930 [candidate division Zixibacteria bacterium]